MLEQLENKYGLPKGILNAVHLVESGGNMAAVSPAGAKGPFQFMDATAKELGVDPFNMESAADGAARYLRQNLDRFGNIDLALAAYNAGPGNVAKYGGIPPFKETQNYIQKVNAQMPQKPGNFFDQFDEAKKSVDATEGNFFDQFDEVQADFKAQSPPSQSAKPDLGRTIFDQAMQGATFGWADEIANPLGAVVAALAKEPSALISGDIKDPALAAEVADAARTTNQRLSQQMQERPIASIGANIAGSLLTGGAGAGTKLGMQMGNMLRGGNLAARVVKGVGSGAALGGLYGAGASEEGKRTKGAREGAVFGGIAGGAAPVVGAVAKSVVPKIDDAYVGVTQLAQKHKIPVSLDQVTGSRALKNIQKVSQEIPLSGQQAFREKQMNAFNRALFKTVGMDADKFTRINMDKAFLEVGRKFDNFGKGKTFNAKPLAQGIKEILDDAPNFATKDAINILETNVKKVIGEVQGGQVQGEKLNLLRSRINAAARKTNLPDAQELLKDLENVVIETLAQGDEDAIRQAKHQYKNLLVLEPLAAKSKGGNISPTELTSRVSRIYGRQFVRGKAGEIGELADVGRELLPELGGSDTTQKLAYLTAAGTMATNPMTIAPITAGVAGNRAMQSFMNRNQSLIRMLSAQQQRELMALPPAQANAFLEGLRVALPTFSAAIAEGTNK